MVNIEMYLPPLDEQDKFVNFKNKLMKNNVLFKTVVLRLKNYLNHYKTKHLVELYKII